MDATFKEKRERNPRERNPILIAFFLWTLPTFLKGSKRDLDTSDLYEPLKAHKSETLANRLEKCWEQELAKASFRNKKPSLRTALLKCFGFEFMCYGIFLLVVDTILKLTQPIILGLYLDYFKPEPAITKDSAFIYGGAIILNVLLSILTIHPYMASVLHLGMKLRLACCSLIYRKALRLNSKALCCTTPGEIVNLLSNDVNRFDTACIFLHMIYIGPIQTLVVTYFLYKNLGISGVIGVASVLIFVPLQGWLGKETSKLRLKIALRTDERVRIMNEIISGIQVIKMYTWEKPFAKIVEAARRLEVKPIRKSSYIRGVLLSFVMFSSRFSTFVTLVTYIFLGNFLTAQKVFILQNYFNILRVAMHIWFPQGIAQFAEMSVSIKRLEKFLSYEETMTNRLACEIKNKMLINGCCKPGCTNSCSKNCTKHKSLPSIEEPKKEFYKQFNGDLKLNSNDSFKTKNTIENKEPSICIKNVTAKWLQSSHENTLTNVSLEVKSGALIAIIGTVGSGKSSLLNVILNELELNEGTVDIAGKISYAAQEPWLFAGSVRANILFGLPFDRQRYKKTVQQCSLERDFQLFPYGDKTIVGERGVSLSGGQRARINLARAVYREADIYLLDDPLSAVDAHVGSQLFTNCIENYLSGKIRILITHQLQYLNEVDEIVLMDTGKIIAKGTFKELKASGLDFTKLLQNKENENSAAEILPCGPTNPCNAISPVPCLPSVACAGDPILKKGNSIHNITRENSFQSVESYIGETNFQPGEVSEQKSTGSMGSYVYKSYFRAGGSVCTFIVVIFTIFLAQLFGSGGDFFISTWVDVEESRIWNCSKEVCLEEHLEDNNSTNTILKDLKLFLLKATNDNQLPREFYMIVFTILTAGTVTITLLRSYLFYKFCMRASVNLHNKMFESIIRAKMYFFNTNTSGRILNRFSKDMGIIDELLPMSLIDTLQYGLSIIGIVVVIAVLNYLLLIPTLLVAIIFYFLRAFYLKTSRSIKRLEGITRSPVYAHINASMQGLPTIRAFNAEKILMQEFDKHQDLHSGAWFFFINSSRGFGMWLDLISLIYVATVTLSFLFIPRDTFGGKVGLAITQCIGIQGMLQWAMRQSTEAENNMTSVERVLEYTNLPSEPPLETQTDKKPPSLWPEKGKVEFKHLYLRYSENEPPVLKDLTFVINPTEKIGIVGRTGAGKSSLIQALFRLAEMEGSIEIDNIDTQILGLHDLRSKVSIIPQEPILFSGTMRKNLDPFDEYPDQILWDALEYVNLKEIIKEIPGGLNGKVMEGGSNFSIGQRQLVCLARAIVRNNKILILDEATANVDPQTDNLIQKTIRSKFSSCTVLTIAHRLHTIMDSDKVLVMDAGRMVEFDHPYLLLEKNNGMFKGLVMQTGPCMAPTLYDISKESYNNQKYKKDENHEKSE